MIKTARRLCALLLAALICTTAGTLICSAAGKTYTIPEINEMEIVLNDDMTAVTRSSDASDSFFSQHGLDYSTTVSNMQSNNIYLQGADSMSTITLTVSMTETEESKAISGYQLLGYSELSELARSFREDPAYTECTIDEASSANWLIFKKLDEVGNKFVYQANTVYGGKIVNITLQRNSGNVIGSDFAVFDSIVSSVSFAKGGAGFDITIFLIIGGAVLLILAIIVIVLIIRRTKHKSKKNKNSKILEELADQYSKPRRGDYSDEQPQEDEDEYEYEDISSFKDKDEAYDGGYRESDSFDFDYEEPSSSADDDDYASFDSYDAYSDGSSKGGTRKFTDDEINALLGETEDSEDFSVALPELEEEPKTEPQETAPITAEQEITIHQTPVQAEAEEAEAVTSSDPEPRPEPAETEQPEIELTVLPPVQTGQADEEPEPEPSLQLIEPEAPEVTESAEEPQAELTPQQVEPEAQDEAEQKPAAGENIADTYEFGRLEDTEEFARVRYDLSEFDERDPLISRADEAAAREEAAKTRFVESDDFFEEAPKRTLGTISREDIAEAEEYDVIGEVEKKAGELEKEAPVPADNSKGAVKKIGDGFKYVGTHMGYFATNVSHEIKRSRAKKKREKAEAERRARADKRKAEQSKLPQSRPQNRPQPRPDGLVQVHSRGTRRPPQKNRRG